MKINNYELTKEEQQLEKEIAAGEWMVDPKNESVAKQFEDAAKKMVLKDKKVNFRTSNLLFLQVKAKAGKVGLSYQTLINTLLHKYASGEIKINL